MMLCCEWGKAAVLFRGCTAGNSAGWERVMGEFSERVTGVAMVSFGRKKEKKETEINWIRDRRMVKIALITAFKRTSLPPFC